MLNRIKNSMEKLGLKIAVAESLTTGNLQAKIGSISGSSNFYEGGITTYSLQQKVKHLGVDKLHAEEVNSVSDKVAIEMAKGVCKLFDCDLGIGTTGYAEPDFKMGINIPYAFVAIWNKSTKNTHTNPIISKKIEGKFEERLLNRKEMQEYVSITVLDYLADYLEILENENAK